MDYIATTTTTTTPTHPHITTSTPPPKHRPMHPPQSQSCPHPTYTDWNYTILLLYFFQFNQKPNLDSMSMRSCLNLRSLSMSNSFNLLEAFLILTIIADADVSKSDISRRNFSRLLSRPALDLDTFRDTSAWNKIWRLKYSGVPITWYSKSRLLGVWYLNSRTFQNGVQFPA